MVEESLVKNTNDEGLRSSLTFSGSGNRGPISSRGILGISGFGLLKNKTKINTFLHFGCFTPTKAGNVFLFF